MVPGVNKYTARLKPQCCVQFHGKITRLLLVCRLFFPIITILKALTSLYYKKCWFLETAGNLFARKHFSCIWTWLGKEFLSNTLIKVFLITRSVIPGSSFSICDTHWQIKILASMSLTRWRPFMFPLFPRVQLNKIPWREQNTAALKKGKC